jgi:hypothetical protein
MVKIDTQKKKTTTEYTTRRANLREAFNIKKNAKINVKFRREGEFIVAEQRITTDDIIAVPKNEDPFDWGIDGDTYYVETTKDV